MAKFIKRIYPVVKKVLSSLGIEANLKKNLWYLDPFKILESAIKTSNPVIFDVGACSGSTTIHFRRLFANSIIHSFEPFADSFSDLQRNLNGVSNVVINNVALSNESGSANFYANESSATNSLLKSKSTDSFIDDLVRNKFTVTVETEKLDDYVARNNIEKIDILKMDVQGSELKILEGATKALKEKKIRIIYCEIWFKEVYTGQALYHEVACFLNRYDYQPFGIYNMHYRNDGQFLWGDAIFVLNEFNLS